jgi:hypothetical protein
MTTHAALTHTLAAFALLLPAPVRAAPHETIWSGAGAWAEGAAWSAGLPDALMRARVAGRSNLALEHGRQIVAGLLVGTGTGDDAQLRIAGGELIVRRTMIQIGEMPRGAGEVLLDGGALHCIGPIYLGSAGGVSDRACRGTLRIRGGSLAARILTLGWGSGAEATLAIEGSRATAVRLLDYVPSCSGPPCRCARRCPRVCLRLSPARKALAPSRAAAAMDARSPSPISTTAAPAACAPRSPRKARAASSSASAARSRCAARWWSASPS